MKMLKVTDLRAGKFIILGNNPCEVLEYSHTKLGRGGAIVKTKLKNLKSGATIDRTFKGQEKIEEASLSLVTSQFLYHQNPKFYFMNSKTFNQFSLNENKIGKDKNFLKEGSEVDVLFSRNEPISIKLPVKIKYRIKHTEPGVKGNTQSTATKEAVIETGFKLQVPLFIKEDDSIIVDTRNGEYVERA